MVLVVVLLLSVMVLIEASCWDVPFTTIALPVICVYVSVGILRPTEFVEMYFVLTVS